MGIRVFGKARFFLSNWKSLFQSRSSHRAYGLRKRLPPKRFGGSQGLFPGYDGGIGGPEPKNARPLVVFHGRYLGYAVVSGNPFGWGIVFLTKAPKPQSPTVDDFSPHNVTVVVSL